MRIQQVTYPTGTLITLAEAKAHLRVTIDNEDSVINDCIKSATSLVESYTNQYLQSRTFVAFLDIQEFTAFNVIDIWKFPITSIESIKYLDFNVFLKKIKLPFMLQMISKPKNKTTINCKS
jgi:uncharacterized phiE125 gp8 family phage protein